jgi:hypothetical protein
VRPVVSRKDRRVGDAVFVQVIGARARFCVLITGLSATRDDDHRRDLLPVQIDRVIEPRREHRRRCAVVLRGAQHDDRLRRSRLVATRRQPHLHEGDREVREQERADEQETRELPA